ncbi:MAG: DUF3373 family protein [Nitrospirota bacterium]
MKKVLLVAMSFVLLTAGFATAADETSWLEIGGDYQYRFDSVKGTVHEYYNFQDVLPWQLGGMTTPPPATVKSYDVKNDSLMTNRFGLNLKANAMEDVSVKARLIMYKVWGHETSGPADGAFFSDRATGPNDGTVGHIPEDNTLRVDYAYATVSNIGQLPLWFSVGRRPTTGGVPTNLKNNEEKTGSAGVPAIMVDYAFDGATVGYAPDIEVMPGAFVKLCYGKGFDSGFTTPTGSSLKDTSFYGVMASLYDTESLKAQVQYQKGAHIFDAPSDGSALTGPVRHNLGDIDWIGGVVMGKVHDLNLFLSAAQSKTHPNDELFQVDAGPFGLVPVAGLMYDAGSNAESRTGTAVYIGGRYDIESLNTKIGVEYNQGSKNWIGMVPAADDVWTSKLGTRGSVYEIYVIQELKNQRISKKGKAFFKVGYQSYKFDYTGSNNWVGAPKKISDLATSPANAQMLAPVEKATDIYLTFEVRF